ncbi:MAG: hypothetical protein L0Z53_22785 [Acidobacteriales bacterium]|nr:hypothetical protein [Terriglobales bacterium]
MNRELLGKIQKHIVRCPHLFSMADFQVDVRACIATWAVRLAGEDPDQVGCIETAARKLLRITKAQAAALFYVSGWPKKFRQEYAPDGRIPPRRACANNACLASARIQHLLARGK